MKRLIAVVALVMVMAVMMTACGKFKCALCREEKFGIKHETTVLGQEIVYCSDCAESLDNLSDSLDSLTDLFK